MRFEPGEEKEIQLVELGGKRTVYGLNDLICGNLDEIGLEKAMDNAQVKNLIDGEMK